MYKNIEDTTLETMHGDLTKLFIEELENAQDSWQKLSESAQDEVIYRCRLKAENVIKKIAGLVAGQGFDTCNAMVDSVSFKSGAKIMLTAIASEAVHKVADSINENVVIVLCNPDAFLGESEQRDDMPEAMPDQRVITECFVD